MNFSEPLVTISAIVLAIMVLTVFFKLLSWIGSFSGSKTKRLKFGGIINDKTPATVYLSGGTIFENVCLAGFTERDNLKQAFPYELSGMVILEHADRSKTIVKAKAITRIEVPPPSE